MIGIGIDTGGTCTDAVVFDTRSHQVLSQSKTLTTKRDLKVGILTVLKGLEKEAVSRAQYISLSTTLATNACVEHKGGRAKLVLIGVNPAQIEKTREAYGLPSLSEIYFMTGDAKKDDSPENTPDWGKLKADLQSQFAEYDSAAIVQVNPKYDDGAYEIEAARIIGESLGIPCVRGYELYQELNVLRRGATALLNARLLPVMKDFFASIDASLTEMNLHLPIVIVRSDGTIMSKEFAAQRPVETLLCGPAASIIGAMELSSYEDALIVDIGGTTSDVAFVKNGVPVSTEGGITIGEWKTMVKGVSIDTFALGGDSAVKYKGRNLYLQKRRYIPLCMLASQYPEVMKKLKTLVHMDQPFSYPAHEFFVLMGMPENLARYTIAEQRFIKALALGPLIFKDAANAARISPHVLHMKRLEDEGVVMRAGMTPTDAMHVFGDYTEFDCEASRLGAAYLSSVTKLPAEEVCKEIYNLTKSRLYSNLVRILMKYKTGKDLTEEETEQLEKLTTMIFSDQVSGSGSCLIPSFVTPSRLIGIGAPTKIFMEDVARLLGTEADFPEAGKVANAIGAAMGNISTESTIIIEPYKGIKSSYLTYVITGGEKTFSIPEYSEAVEAAKRLAKQAAEKRARQQGALGAIEVELTVKENTYQRNKYAHPELLDTKVTAKALWERE